MVKILKTNIKNDGNNTSVNLFIYCVFFLKIYFLQKDYDKKEEANTSLH
jgi:hypothetical protein